jgi:hypothetical protein
MKEREAGMLISTTKGNIEEALLDKREGKLDNDNELTTWVEHWHGGQKACAHKLAASGESRICLNCGSELVHRSASIKLKKMPPMSGELNLFG